MTEQLAFVFDNVQPLRPELEQFCDRVRYLSWLAETHPDVYERVMHDPRPVHAVPGEAA